MLLWIFLVGFAAANEEFSLENKTHHAQYRGSQVLRVRNATESIRNLLKSLEGEKAIEIWKQSNVFGKFTDILVPSFTLSFVRQQFENLNATFRVMIADVESAMHEQIAIAPRRQSNKNKKSRSYNLTFQRYHRISDIYAYLEYLVSKFPSICSIETIGTTIQGREIKVLKISGSNAKFGFYIEGGIHAREWVSPASVAYIVRELVEYRSKNSFAENADYYVSPVANPDGYEFTHTNSRLWRKNRRDSTDKSCPGVDLNRNYGYQWGGLGASRQSCDETFAGENSFSEPETQAVRDFLTKIGPSVQAYVAFHSYGQYILYPYGYDKVLAPDSAVLQKLGARIARNIKKASKKKYKVGNSAILLYEASGGADDWAKGSVGIKYTYTIELRDAGRYGFLLPASQIEATGKDAFIAIKTITQEIAGIGRKKKSRF
ncbi:Hypothetical predicted protein [Cloeon dipterum]|uniref:Peptidase M14 domain-containing protein n=2 Tax=Cloeon dipterum TaxID=197152 RepID=A0A8S1DDG0_9INSE|nr:Hypothetical predicted protein [Cloeon dipterum]